MLKKLISIISLFVTAEVLIAQDFSVSAIPDCVFQRMQGRSWPKSCNISRDDLRYLTVKYTDEKGKDRRGELVCNRAVANELLDIFRELYKVHYPIHSIRLIDDFNGDDERSMEANNTSCFNYRKVKDIKKISSHSLGRAVDINPQWNPCFHRSGKIEPKNASKSPVINTSDQCYRIFHKHGWHWGGLWRRKKDYQHFEK